MIKIATKKEKEYSALLDRIRKGTRKYLKELNEFDGMHKFSNDKAEFRKLKGHLFKASKKARNHKADIDKEIEIKTRFFK